MDASPCCFIQDSLSLRDLNGLGDLLLRLRLRHGDGQDAVLHLGRDLIFHNIIRQRVALLVVRVAELATQIVMMFVLMLVFGLVPSPRLTGSRGPSLLDGDGQVALVVDADSAIFFLQLEEVIFNGRALASFDQIVNFVFIAFSIYTRNITNLYDH